MGCIRQELRLDVPRKKLGYKWFGTVHGLVISPIVINFGVFLWGYDNAH